MVDFFFFVSHWHYFCFECKPYKFLLSKYICQWGKTSLTKLTKPDVLMSIMNFRDVPKLYGKSRQQCWLTKSYLKLYNILVMNDHYCHIRPRYLDGAQFIIIRHCSQHNISKIVVNKLLQMIHAFLGLWMKRSVKVCVRQKGKIQAGC